MIQNTNTNGQRTILNGGNRLDFYKNVDLNDMYNYYQIMRQLHPNTCRDLISYFKRFRDLFFNEKAEGGKAGAKI